MADSTENYLGFETDLQDLELGYLLQRADRRLEVVFFWPLIMSGSVRAELSFPSSSLGKTHVKNLTLLVTETL